MPYFATSQEWLTQSALLLQARPSTTRITTKYKIIPPSTPKPKRSSSSTIATPPTPAAQPPNTTPRATLTLKTYDPVSGVCLKYRTDKAAEVGRLIMTLGRLGRGMAGLKGEEVGVEDASMEDAVVEGGQEKAEEKAAEKEKAKEAVAGGSGGGGGGGAKKGKGKKGKK